MPKSYLSLFRPADTVTFGVTAAVTAGQVVQVGAADWAVAPAAADSTSVVGVAGHDAAVGDKVTVEVGKVIHELIASGPIARGTRVEAATGGKVATLSGEAAFGVALASAVDGAAVPVVQL